MGFPPLHVPPWHVSVCVHPFPSLHALPSDFAGFEQLPVAGVHVPALWHWSGAGQTTEFPPMHVPPWHVSVCVHAFPSLHALPSDFAGFEQVPVAGLHVPASCHWSGVGQTTAFPPVHVPPWHVSVWVHALPSLHALPSGFAGLEQVPV